MKIISSGLLLLACVGVALCSRAFPVESENEAVRLFQTINQDIEWDPTNFLIDYSGQFTKCAIAEGRQRGELRPAPPRRTPEGEVVSGLTDYEQGSNTDAESVNVYINNALRDWTTDYTFSQKIRSSTKFGCSVQPACRGGFIAISCLFNADSGFHPPPPPPENIVEVPVFDDPPNARAFTSVQYIEAEDITGIHWDDSFFLENLSGTTKSCTCTMVGQHEWDYSYAIAYGADRGMTLKGQFGYSENLGTTEDAMRAILNQWDEIYSVQTGCSIIPDCIDTTGRMWVVMSCLHEI